MSCQSDARDLSTALTALSGSVLTLLGTLTTDPGYSAAETQAASRRDAVGNAIGIYVNNASQKLAINVSWGGVEQSNVELCAKLTSLITVVGAVGADELAQASSVFSSCADTHGSRSPSE